MTSTSAWRECGLSRDRRSRPVARRPAEADPALDARPSNGRGHDPASVADGVVKAAKMAVTPPLLLNAKIFPVGRQISPKGQGSSIRVTVPRRRQVQAEDRLADVRRRSMSVRRPRCPGPAGPPPRKHRRDDGADTEDGADTLAPWFRSPSRLREPPWRLRPHRDAGRRSRYSGSDATDSPRRPDRRLYRWCLRLGFQKTGSVASTAAAEMPRSSNRKACAIAAA